VSLRGGITIFASDLAASRRFYGDQLGLEVDDDADGFWARADGLELRVEGGARKRRLSRDFYEQAGVLVRLETTSFDTFLGGIIARGIKLFGEVKDSDEGRFVGFVDPDGNLFELIEREG
jgi:catechol 2,3-dioxygenase-like lactoylglutathione lyase family enzyme